MRTVILACLAFLLLVGPVGADGPTDEGKDPGLDAARYLFPFGVREQGRPDAGGIESPTRAKAVTAGLDWLAAHQAPSGLWEAADLSWCRGHALHKNLEGKGKAIYGPGVTGIALLAFLAHGYHHLDGSPYAAGMAAALKAFQNIQDAEGCFGPRTTQHFLYNHAFANLAVLEAYGATGDAQLLEPARKGLAFLVLARNPYFAWRYGVKPGDNDTSMTGCVSMSFIAARKVNRAATVAGLEAPLPFPSDVLVGATTWIDKMTDKGQGRTGYIQRGGTPARPQEKIDEFPGEVSESMTAIGLLVRLMAGARAATPEDAVLNQKATKLLLALAPRWDVAGGRTDLYYWYYGCLALHEMGGEPWSKWWSQLESALVGAQRTDTDVCRYEGSWDPHGPWGEDGGRIYSTGIALLCLGTPNRFHPFTADRLDLAEALTARDGSTHDPLHLLEAVEAYEVSVPGADLVEPLSATRPETRAAAARAVTAVDPDGALVEALAGCLADAGVRVRREAAGALGRLGEQAGDAAPALGKALGDQDDEVRRRVLGALAAIGLPAAPQADAVKPLLGADALAIRIEAAGALARMGARDAATDALLVEGIGAKDAAIRTRAAAHLAAIGPTGAPIRDALRAALDDDACSVRLEAARGLLASDAERAALARVLADCLRKDDRLLQRHALHLVQRMGRDAKTTAPQVVPLVFATQPRHAVAAIEAVAALGADAPDALATLRAASKRSTPSVRAAAQGALATLDLGKEAQITLFAASLASPDPRVAEGAVDGLIAAGRAAEEAVRGRLESAKHGGHVPALRVLAALGPKASRRSTQAVLAVLRSSTNVEVQVLAMSALGAMEAQQAEVVSAVMAHAESEHGPMRQAAMASLGRLALRHGNAMKALLAFAERTGKEDRSIRLLALRVLASLGADAKPALDTYEKALGDDDAEIRYAAAEGISQLGKKALTLLRETIRGERSVRRAASLDALRLMGPEARRAIPDLVEAMEKESLWTAHQYGAALAAIGKKAVGPLKKLLKSKNAAARAAAARALGTMGEDAKSAKSTLKRLMDDPEENVRKEAAAAFYGLP